jgi:hypothetical protein
MTATPLNTAHRPVRLPTQRPLLQRLVSEVRSLRQAWQERRRYAAEQRALRGLDEATLRDLGLAERRLDGPTLPMTDYERGRW